jgi:hypothetical protein
MDQLPLYISISFAFVTLTTVALLYLATNSSRTTLIVLLAWLALQSIPALSGFYLVTNTTPPRFPLLVLPPLLLIATLFATVRGRQYIDSINIKSLTMLHIIRIPVELVLLALFLHKAIPGLMTFEGRNFDMLSGLTAPVVYYFGFVKKRISRKGLVLWNYLCLALLLNIVINAMLSAPSPIQQFAFDQPNIAILYFPFIWLPCCVVPIVLFAHLVAIRQLTRRV